MPSYYHKIFFVRFLSYFFIISGFLALVLTVEPVVSEEVSYNLNNLTGRHNILPKIVTSVGEGSSLPVNSLPVSKGPPAARLPDGQGGQGFGGLLGGGEQIISPVSTDFGIVIEKINANAKVIANVDPANERAYTQALGLGVAHTKGTAFPGQKGNIYLFSHSTDAPWNIVRYNAIFYLLGKLDPGDRIVMFYQGRRFDYIVFDKQIVKPGDTHFLTDSYDKSVLTLQTCDPPGTLANRLVIRAKLAGQ